MSKNPLQRYTELVDSQPFHFIREDKFSFLVLRPEDRRNGVDVLVQLEGVVQLLQQSADARNRHRKLLRSPDVVGGTDVTIFV